MGYHVPIMLREVMDLIKPERGGIYVDGTMGGCGHSKEIFKSLPNGSRLIGIDRDTDAIEHAKDMIESTDGKEFMTVHGNFFDVKAILESLSISGIDGMLLDLGVSSHQLDEAERGFSYMADAALDMRMDRTHGITARDVVNGYSHGELARIFREYGEERYAGKIASEILKVRQNKAIETTGELVGIIKSAMPQKALREKQHPAKRVFQGIRIEVNGELSELHQAIEDAVSVLNPNGVLAVITFHSLEDRIVKQAFFKAEHPCTCDPKAPICTCGKVPTAKVLTKKPIIPTDEETDENPRARSAKLRAVKRI